MVVQIDDEDVIALGIGSGLVARAVSAALLDGWTPAERGPELFYRLEGNGLVVRRVVRARRLGVVHTARAEVGVREGLVAALA